MKVFNLLNKRRWSIVVPAMVIAIVITLSILLTLRDSNGNDSTSSSGSSTESDAEDRVGVTPVAILDLLQQHGLEPVSAGVSRAELLRPTLGQVYRFNSHSDSEQLFLHVYPSVESAESKANQIRVDRRVHELIDWIAPPHFFQCDDLIALYLGYNEKVITVLEELCGAQIAGRE